MIGDVLAAGLDRPLLVGHSQGGQAISLMLDKRADLFRRIVHIACSIPLPGQSVQAMMGRGLRGSDADEVGWPFDPADGGIADRYPRMFCTGLAADRQQAFLAKLGADAWPLSTYGHTAWRHDHHAAFPPPTSSACKTRSFRPPGRNGSRIVSGPIGACGSMPAIRP